MQTPITEMFGIEFPIVAFTHCRDVVVAVSKAGGLGVLGAVAHSDAQLETDLAWIEDELGDRPYGIDLIVPARYAGSDEGGLSVADLVSTIPGSSSGTACPRTPSPPDGRHGPEMPRSQPTGPTGSWTSPWPTARYWWPTPSARHPGTWSNAATRPV